MNIQNSLSKNHLRFNEYHDCDIIDLIQTIYQRKGLDLKVTENMKQLQAIIPDNKHILIIIANGLGSKLIDQLPVDHPWRQGKRKDLFSVIPSTTSCAATSFITGTPPLEHQVLGNYMHNKKYNMSYENMELKDRINRKELSTFDIPFDQIITKATIFEKLNCRCYSILPANHDNLKYYHWLLKDTNMLTYRTLDDAMKKALRIPKTTLKPTITFLFVEKLIDVFRLDGVGKKTVVDTIDQITPVLSRLKKKNVTTIITSFHGLMTPYTSIVMNYTKYNKYFYALPSIEERITSFYIKEGMEEEFAREFHQDFGNLLALYRTEELIQSGLFGPSHKNATLPNIGQFIAISLHKNYLEIPTNQEEYTEQLNNPEPVHILSGGLSEEELLVPLILL